MVPLMLNELITILSNNKGGTLMTKYRYTAIFLALLLAVLPACGFAYYEGGAPTPEDAIEQYYWGQYMLDAPMTIEVTQFSDGFASIIRKYATTETIRAYWGDDYCYIAEEIEYYNGDAVEWYIQSYVTCQERDCLKQVFQQELNRGTLPYRQSDVEIQFVELHIPSTDYPDYDFFTYSVQPLLAIGIPVENSAVVICNIYDKPENHITTKTVGLYQIDGSWYVEDPCNWHYYVE